MCCAALSALLTEPHPSADVFTVFEEYDVDEGIHAHVAGETFQALAGAGVIADLDIK